MSKRAFKPYLIAFIFVGLLGFGQAFAMGSNSSDEKKVDKNFKAGETAIKAWKWDEAITHLTKSIKSDPSNADAHNYLGYAYRNKKSYVLSFKHYKEALKIAPEHKGAHEYIGQAYLQNGNLKMAEKHLSALDKICLFGCEEYDELKAAVAAYKKKNKSS